MNARLLLLVFCLAGVAAAVPGDPVPRAAAVGGFAQVTRPRLPDPFPLRRVLLPSETDPRLIPEPGGFRRLTLDEFEARVDLAAQELAARANPPRVREAVYRTAYSPGQLAGTAEWTVANPARRSGFAALDPLALAVGSAKWADGRAAILTHDTAADRPTGADLWVDDPTGGVVTVPWSLRGAPSADEDRFEIVAPVVPLAVWEVKLPADRTPAVPTAGVLLSGPFPDGLPTEKRWRVTAGNVPRWELRVRRPAPPGDLLPLHAARAAAHTLSPGAATAVIEFKLESPRRAVRDWSFQVDAPLAVTDVTGDDVERWAVEGGKLTVRLLEPATATRVRIGVSGPLPGGGTAWSCPTVKLLGGTLGADTVEAAIHPDFKLEGWTPGDYRLTGGGVPPDRGYRLTFVGTLAATDAEHRRPPAIRLRPAEVELATEEALDWHLDPGRNRLTAQVKARAVRGPATAVAVQLAAGHAVVGVTAVPDDPGLTWTAGPGNTWSIEPSRPVGTGQAAEFRIEVAGPPAPFAGDPIMPEPLAVAVPWPKFAVLAATDRQGTIRVSAGGGLKANLPKAGPLAEDGAVPYRGREPDGTIVLTAPRPAVSLVAAEFDVSGRSAVRLLARAEGPVHSVTVYAPGEATVRAESTIARARRLPALGTVGFTPLFGATSGWAAVAAAGFPEVLNGSLWRVTFPTPERGEFAVWVEDLPAEKGEDGLRIGRPVLCGADEAAVVVRGDGPRCPADEFRRAAKAFPPTVVVRDTPAQRVAPRDVRYADLRLVSSAEAGGLTATLSGSVSGAGGGLAVGLPAGTVVESASVAGKRLPGVAGASGAIRLPLPADSAVSFELRYRLPSTGNALLRTYRSPTPMLPGDPTPTRLWAFPDGGRAWPELRLQPDPEPRAAESVSVTPDPTAVAVSYSLAAVLLGLAAALVRAGGRGLWPFAAMGLTLGTAVWAAPGGWPGLLRPAFVTVAAGVAVLVLVRPVRTSVSIPSASTASAPALLLLLAVSGVAQAPAPAVVYVVPDPANASQFRAFVPAAVLERLEKAAAPALPAATILTATYDAVAGEDAATVHATFTVLGTRAGNHSLVLPLSGIRLERATLDGKDAFPDTTDGTRIAVTIPGEGRRELRLKYAVPTVRRGADRECRFGVPDVPSTTVALVAGANGRQPEILSRRGGQKVLPTGAGPRAEADHGGGTTVAGRWRDGGTNDGAKPTVTVRELSLWDVGETDATVTAAFAYRIAGGQLNRLTIQLPDSVETERVLVRAGDALSPIPGLQGWTVGPSSNGWHPLELRLQQPTDGRVLVVVVGHPRRPLTARPVLRMPRADTEAGDRDSYHAIRLSGLNADGIGVAGAVDFPSEPLQKEFALPEFAWTSGPLARMVRRAPNAVAEFRPNLQPVPGFTAGPSEVIVTVGRRVSYDGLMRAADADGMAVEFTTPGGVRPTDVRGIALAGWGFTGGRVQAWFRQPVPSAAVRWSATSAADIVPPGGVPPEGLPVDVAWPRWSPSAGGEPIRVTVRAAPGFELMEPAVVGAHPVAGAAAGEFAFTLEPGTHPPGRFKLKAAAPKPAIAPKGKAVEPPAPKPEPPSIPPPLSNDPPVAEPAREWPHGILAWCGGYVAVLWLARFGRRFRPECAAGVGVLGALAVGWSTVFGVGLFAVAAVGVLLRAARVLRWR